MSAGLVLAGVGRDPFAPADDPPIRRVADDLDPVVDDLLVVCDADQRADVADALEGVDYRAAVDPVARDSVVAAIRTGVRFTTERTVAVVPGDVGVDAALFDSLFDACDGGAVPRADGRLYPLHAVYEAAAVRAACDRTLASGSVRLYDVLSRLDPAVVGAEGTSVDRIAPEARARSDLAPATDSIGT